MKNIHLAKESLLKSQKWIELKVFVQIEDVNVNTTPSCTNSKLHGANNQSQSIKYL